jgi:uncharacterized membrane protein YfbV (UPF0208 family)
MIFTLSFWKLATERAVKTFAQTALALLGASTLNVLTVDWQQAIGVSAGAAVLSYLTSVVSVEITKSGISLVKPE